MLCCCKEFTPAWRHRVRRYLQSRYPRCVRSTLRFRRTAAPSSEPFAKMECRRSAFEWLESLQLAQVDVSCEQALQAFSFIELCLSKGRGSFEFKAETHNCRHRRAPKRLNLRSVWDGELLNARCARAVGKCSEECLPTSPRSVEACLRLGIDPLDLVQRPLDVFKGRGEDEDIARYRHQQYESARQDLTRQLLLERQKLTDMHVGKGPSRQATDRQDGNKADLVEKEKQRLEVLKRRQERELKQMLNHEQQRQQMMARQQAKVEAVEKRAAEMRRKKAGKDAEWRKQQRQRELNRLKEMEELEAASRRDAALRFQKEQEQQRAEQKEVQRRKQLALEQEKKHREKAERARLESQRALEEQQEAVRQRRAEMEKRDAERQKKIKEEQEQRAIDNQAKRKLAQERLEAALEKDKQIQAQKQHEFQKREAFSEQRRAEMEKQRRDDERRRKEVEKQKEACRKEKYELSLKQEQLRKQAIQERSEQKEQMLGELREKQQKENAYAAVERELKANLKREKAERMRKIQTYQRQMLFNKIMQDRNKIGKQLEEKESLQKQRRMANMQASMERQKLNALMEDMKKKQTHACI